MAFNLLYSIFIFCVSVLSLQTYGLPLTPRQIMAVIMFFVCVTEDKKLWIDKYFRLYIVFIVCFGLSCFMSGHMSEFFKRLVGDYFVAYVALWSTKIAVINKNSLRVFIGTVLSIGLFDGILTLFQFLGLPYLDSFVNRLHLISYDPYLNNYQGSAMLNRCAPGIFSHPVLNAHVLMACTIMALIPLGKKTGWKSLLLCTVLLICVFADQQRTALAASIVFVLFYLYKTISKTRYKIAIYPFFLIALFLGFSMFYDFVMSGEFRFSELGMDSTGRDEIYSDAIAYILSNPLGGIYEFVEQSNYPHNLLFNALIFGGWFGGLAIFIIIIKQIKECIGTFRDKNASSIVTLLACTVCAMVLNGITHNQSIVNGEVVTWMVWGAYIFSKQKSSYIIN